ncbi:hypothetical protein [Devosia sp. A369]
MGKSNQDQVSASTDLAAKVGTPVRKDGRRPLLVYLDPTLIKDLKKDALDREVNVYELVEELLKKARLNAAA